MAEGEFALVRDHLDHANRATSDPVRWGSAVTDLDYLVLRADAAAGARDAETLRASAHRAEQAAAQVGHRLYRAVALRSRAVLALLDGQPGAAVDLASQALQHFEDLGTRYQMGRTLGERARAQDARGDTASARDDWSRALELFQAQGASPAAQEARHALAALQAEG